MTVFQTGLPASATLKLQQCGNCAQVNYPARELCGYCLADALQWQPVKDTGTVQSITELQYSLEPGYTAHLPWRVASIQLDCGPQALTHLVPGVVTGDAVRLKVIQDGQGNVMLLALGCDHAVQQAAIHWLEEVQFKEISA
tara:strand:+ start:10621 stop:11043 length:423 start_codon:yes stop_codon:yes gene_type:complete